MTDWDATDVYTHKSVLEVFIDECQKQGMTDKQILALFREVMDELHGECLKEDEE